MQARQLDLIGPLFSWVVINTDSDVDDIRFKMVSGDHMVVVDIRCRFGNGAPISELEISKVMKYVTARGSFLIAASASIIVLF